MNNLGWIDKQIQSVKENIQYHKDLLTESEEEYADEIISTIKLLEPELQTLEQIKSELEAWEVCKNKMELYQEQHYGLAKETTTKISETMRIRIFVNDQNQVQTIVKALEAEDVINM